jgi:CheY-like chemotaxis protein
MAKILLADDDAATRDLVRRALEMDGHKVTATQDGMEALERLSGGDRFDVLVTDVQMPGLDGIALAERAAAATPGIAILLMSGFPEQLEKSKRIASARVATLSKPFTLEQARAAVRGVVG